jgi:hypothetical protein
VEPPGTAPGSEPIITGAFIAIVGVAPDIFNIGLAAGGRKGRSLWLSTVDRKIESKHFNGLEAGIHDPLRG